MIKYTFAILTKKNDFIVDARNPYNYKTVGAATWEGNGNPSKNEFQAMKKNAEIPDEAVCIRSELVV